MNTHSPHCYLMVWSIALMCAACFHVYGDEAKDNLPLIEQKCVPSFDKGYITLSITNKTDHPVAIDPLIRAEFVFHNGLIMPPPRKEAGERDIIVPSVVFISAPGDHGFSGHGGTGSVPFVTIASGETKTIKLFTGDGSLISMAKGASKATFSLSLNGQDLAKAKVVMTNIGNAWKVEN